MRDTEFHYTAPEPLVLDFDPPVKGPDGATLSRLSLGEPTSGQVYAAELHLSGKAGVRGPRQYQRLLISKVGSVPVEVLDEVPISSFTRAVTHLQAFIEDGLADPNADEGEPASSLTIQFDPPLVWERGTVATLTLTEPTLGMMARAETNLRDMTPQRVRAYQEAVVSMASGENLAAMKNLPISVLNRAATFALGFSGAGRATGV